MKFIPWLLLILFTSCRKEIPASIQVSVTYQDTLHKDLPKLFFLTVYKDGKLFKEYSRMQGPYIKNSFSIDSLSEGTYKFVYLNVLNQTLVKSIVVKENRAYPIAIHPDYSNYSKLVGTSLIKNLKDTEKIELYFKRSSCMGSLKSNLVLTKKGNVLIAENNGRVKELSQREVDSFIKMECELSLIQYGGCTTSDSYTLRSGNVEKEFFDRTCRWEGWRNTVGNLNWDVN